MSEKVTIVTRTNNRPKGFKALREMLEAQTYEKIDHLVLFDDKASMKYIRKYKDYRTTSVYIDFEEVLNEPRTEDPKTGKYFPYNLYLNRALDRIEDGYIFFNDDDEELFDYDTIELMVHDAQKDKLLIGRNDNRGIPSHSWGKEPTFCDIGGGLIFFHKDLVKDARFDCWKCADFRFIKQLEKNANGIIWHDHPIVHSHIIGGNGNARDIDT